MDWPVVGHELASRTLRRAIDTGRIGHAYLLVGPPQVGKTTLARAAAQTLFCNGKLRPCGQCASCVKMQKNVHPDLLVVRPDAKTDNHSIDDVREVQRRSALKPVEAPYKVFILRRFERAQGPAANALLKTLEEPPANVVLFVTLVAA